MSLAFISFYLEAQSSVGVGDEDEANGHPAGPREVENEILSFEETSLHSSTESGKP